MNAETRVPRWYVALCVSMFLGSVIASVMAIAMWHAGLACFFGCITGLLISVVADAVQGKWWRE